MLLMVTELKPTVAVTELTFPAGESTWKQLAFLLVLLVLSLCS